MKPKTVSKKRDRIFSSIVMDPVEAADFNQLNLVYACEDCAHFAPSEQRCTFGFNAENHRRAQQLKTFSLSGRMAICRFLEID